MKTPHQINAYLDQHIIGQAGAKRTLSVALYNHMKRVQNPELKLKKSNVMLIGPSGSGKTLLVKTLADLMGVPFYIGDATAITSAGYIGGDVEDLLTGLIGASRGDVGRAQTGIIFIDEFDKVKKSGGKDGDGFKDVNGLAVQQALLKLLEGTTVDYEIKGNNRMEDKKVSIKTDNILFILGGAFVGLADKKSCVEAPDLMEYGIIPEVLGRVPVLAQLADLTREEMRRVLTEVKNGPIEEYQKLFETEDVELEFCDAALDRVVDLAILKNTGTRSLRSIIELALTDLMFDLPSQRGTIKKMVITAGAIDRTEKPRVYKAGKSKRQQRRDRAKQKQSINPLTGETRKQRSA